MSRLLAVLTLGAVVAWMLHRRPHRHGHDVYQVYVESDRDDQLWANGYYHGVRFGRKRPDWTPPSGWRDLERVDSV